MEVKKTIEKDILIVGGGAAGFFAAINAAEMDPSARICILERGKDVLSKVRISGGGRCNVTHAEFLPQELIRYYPRGEKELQGPFHKFMTGDTIDWFEKRGVSLKSEEDGRMFPESDSSETIIQLFLQEAQRLGIQILTKCVVRQIEKAEPWKITTSRGEFTAKKLLVATGSNPKIWNILKSLGHSIVPGVPSLFTFNIKDARIKNLPGIATHAVVWLPGSKLTTEGPLLITHWGMSGPAILKLSAWGARILSEKKEFNIEINWLPEVEAPEVLRLLEVQKKKHPRQSAYKSASFDIPKRLWQNLVKAANIEEEQNWADLSKRQLQDLSVELSSGTYKVSGKSTFKEEFVTAGGVELKEVDFRRFESRVCANLFLAGEVLNIDAITGGFNFQNAWTGGFIAAQAMTQ